MSPVWHNVNRGVGMPPRQRPTAYALAALFMLLLSNLFPFVNMNVAGVTSEITLLEIPGVLFF